MTWLNNWSLLTVIILSLCNVQGKLLTSRNHGIHWVELPGEETRVTGNEIKCQDEDGNNLDWFVAYKLAKIAKSSDENVKKGLGYGFTLPSSQQWRLSSRNVNDSLSVMGRAIGRIFSKDSTGEILYMAYNDQPPDAATVSGGGHTKGVIIANENGGLWLQHSVPNFPNISGEKYYSYPETGVRNGQVFFCMSLTAKQLNETVGNILQITKPSVFKYDFPASFNNLYDNLRPVLPKKKKRGGQGKKMTDNHAIFNLPVGQLNLTVFAKGPKFDSEIYSDWVAPTLGTNLKVQSWLNGPHPMPSNCTSKTLSVLNILSKKLGGNEFSTHSDHSKWALGGDKKWTCIADLNRMDHQKVRGGAALCTQNENLWESFTNSIVDLMPCQKPNKSSRHITD